MADTHDSTQAALKLAFDLYTARVQAILRDQWAAFSKRERINGIVLQPPDERHLNLIMAALSEARDAGIHDALGPVVQMCDGMDNSDEKKDAAFKRCRARIEEVYQALHAMKSTNLSVAQ